MTTRHIRPFEDRFNRSDRAYGALLVLGAKVSLDIYPACATEDYRARLDTGRQHGPVELNEANRRYREARAWVIADDARRAGEPMIEVRTSDNVRTYPLSQPALAVGYAKRAAKRTNYSAHVWIGNHAMFAIMPNGMVRTFGADEDV